MIFGDLLAIYYSRFVNQELFWAKQVFVQSGKCQYYWQKPEQEYFPYRRLDTTLIADGIKGGVTFSLPAVDEHWCSKWLAFDDDNSEGAIDALEQRLSDWNWHCIREAKREGRGGHLWILFDEPVPASDLIVLGAAMQRLAKVTGLEQFPKFPDKLSALRAPLTIHRKPEANNARGWFEGPPQDIEAQLIWLAEQPLNKAEDAIREAANHKPAPNTERRFQQRRGSTAFMRAPILSLVDARRRGKEFVAACPCCQMEGHDRHADNLRISADGAKFTCVYGGPAQVHSARDIIKALTG